MDISESVIRLAKVSSVMGRASFFSSSSANQSLASEVSSCEANFRMVLSHTSCSAIHFLAAVRARLHEDLLSGLTSSMKGISLPFHKSVVSNMPSSRLSTSVPSILSSTITGLLYFIQTISKSGQVTACSSTSMTAQLLNFSWGVCWGIYSSNSFLTLIRQICPLSNRVQPFSVFLSSSVTGHSSRPSRRSISPVEQNTMPRAMTVISQNPLSYPAPRVRWMRTITSFSSESYRP